MAMTFLETIPPWKMPDEEKFSHEYHVCVKVKSKPNQYYWLADLTEYYRWACDNNMEIEHNVLRMGTDDIAGTIMFTFNTVEDAMAFKLRWK